MDDLPINDALTLPGYELWITTSRSSGPGGQHVNKTNSAVTLHFSPATSGCLTPWQKTRIERLLQNRINRDGVLQVHAQDERSQLRNIDLARARLADLIAQAVVPPKRRKKTRPSKSAKRRRLREKRMNAEKKQSRQKPPHPHD